MSDEDVFILPITTMTSVEDQILVGRWGWGDVDQSGVIQRSGAVQGQVQIPGFQGQVRRQRLIVVVLTFEDRGHGQVAQLFLLLFEVVFAPEGVPHGLTQVF